MSQSIIAGYPHRGNSGFGTWSLSSQFAVIGGLVMLVAMMAAGLFTSSIVSRTTVEHTAVSTALFIENFLAPLVQELAIRDTLSGESTAALDRLLGRNAFEYRFPYVEIWKKGGVVAYSTTPELTGRRFLPPPGLASAMAGEVSAQYTDLDAREHVIRNFSKRYFEVYIPIRERASGRVIAAAEIHEALAPLEKRLWHIRLQSWLVVAAATLLIMLGLFGIVHRGSKIISDQQKSLRRRIVEIEQVAQQNRALKEQAQRASSRVAELTEEYLRRIGAELHDGPAQLISFAALKVDHVRRVRTASKQEKELQSLGSALNDALRDIRVISKGLMLPEIEHLPLREVVNRAVHIHEKRTETKVAVQCGDIRQSFSHAIKICVYRFLQEGLNNAFRHAGGEGQSVACNYENSILFVAVRDSGGTSTNARDDSEAGIGLVGLRERVESLGGVFGIRRDQNDGTAIEMSIVLAGEDSDG